ncbi:BA14K family protein [Rhizobium calliandrae]|uniref:BA14K family protein n=1 Tax=Rhizobium calliandrae TaxID=1312182 RepID=A0ABT7KA32_9HYPH|nr:BA14K family protein [Rhizobium calliandrae]MDL2404808.1 BA14K family protein [Rhizobium calliandrae]
MTVFGKIVFGCAISLALLSPPDLANAAASSPLVIPPRTTGPTVCDYRGCFGFGSEQWYRPPGYPLPNTVSPLDRNRFETPRVVIPPRTNYVAPTTNYRMPVDNRTRHQMWCSEHYRTYNPGTNLYTTLHHGFQTCRSPYN